MTLSTEFCSWLTTW